MIRLSGGTPAYHVAGLVGHLPVVVLHELFGITDHVVDVCHRLADAGHEVIAPDMFFRLDGYDGTPLPETTEGRTAGFRLLAELRMDDVTQLVRSAADVTGASTVGLLGLSVGGHLGFRLPRSVPIQRAVHLYPGWLERADTPLRDNVRALDAAPPPWPTLVVVGEKDSLIGDDARASLESHLATGDSRHKFVTVPQVAHGFLAPHRSSYVELTAKAVWTHVLEWFS